MKLNHGQLMQITNYDSVGLMGRFLTLCKCKKGKFWSPIKSNWQESCKTQIKAYSHHSHANINTSSNQPH